MSQHLSPRFQVETADSQESAIQKLTSQETYDLALIDTGNDTEEALELARAAAQARHPTAVALLSHEPIDGMLGKLRTGPARNVFIKSTPLALDELELLVENILWPDRAVGLARYLREPCQLQEAVITCREDREHVLVQVLNYSKRFRQFESDISEIRLALEEVVNNAIFHSFHRDSGEEKYTASSFRQLECDEQITLEYGHDDRYLGICVTDNQGTLDPEVVISKIDRQITLEGLLDENGRGMHLTRTLCDRMIVNIAPGKLTQIIMLFANQPAPCHKPFYLNLITNATSA